jgi:hypothetical protein
MASGTADEYVFVPLVNDVYYEYDGKTLTFTLRKNNTPNNTPIEIKISNNKHITEINKNKVDINNILVLTGYAIDENSLGLVHTLDPCDYVKGILVNGEIKKLEQNLSIQKIIFSKAEVMNKLYFIRKSKVDLQNDIEINLITVTKSERVGKTNYRSLKINNKDEKEEFKKKIKGIIDLYGIQEEKDIDNLVEKLSDIINYYSI